MGTRHLICIYHNGRFAVAQYGHYDGYPSAAGMAVLRFLTIKANIQRLRDNMHFVPPPTKPLGQEGDSRGVAILNDIATACEPLERVFFTLDFASNGLFCEWAYVVDLDNEGALKVYKGSRDYRGTTAGRFGEAGVVQQELKARFAFGGLPGGEEEFVRACGGYEDEDDAYM
jgi:hypothetical protein